MSTPAAPRAMIVADDAHVTYRVYASGKRVGPREKLLSLSAVRGGRGLKSVQALRGVSFTASEGETIGVVGHNGSGKSTLFKAMSGLIPTSAGAIWARERPVLLGVNAALVPELSGEDNIKLGLLAMGFTKAEAAAHVDEIADFAELNEFIHHPMRTYSSGMGARLRFAIASAKSHSILLVDEALAVGDRKFRRKSEQRIRQLRDSAGLVMIVSHSVGSLEDSCERVLWVHKGELRADGPAKAVINDYVKWTKDPKSFAVGGAHAPQPNRDRPRPVTATPSTTPATEPAPTVGMPAEIAELLGAVAGVSSGNGTPAAVTVDTPENARTVARRARYRETVRARRRRRLIAVVTTIVTLLIAAAAGAAIALLANAPEPPATPAAAGETIEAEPVEVNDQAPTVRSFSAAEPTASCASADGEVGVTLSWRTLNAAKIALATAPTRVDALDSPMMVDVPAEVDAQVVAFPCVEDTRIYTLTAESADGRRASASVSIERVLVKTESPDDSDTTRPPAPESTPSPQQSAPALPSAPVRSPDPQPTSPSQPTSPPQPTSPEPSATLSPTDPDEPAQPDPVETADPSSGIPEPEISVPAG
ncbi:MULTISPECIES: ABC transporter ATP-binding protein [unclassified Microbacterium]|uniref:ABC transporter ATP-binding protein n=1 Tax=unclassified Microbacterium TaxID=2609290 RepID=UPI003C3015D3